MILLAATSIWELFCLLGFRLRWLLLRLVKRIISVLLSLYDGMLSSWVGGWGNLIVMTGFSVSVCSFGGNETVRVSRVILGHRQRIL